MAPRFHPLRASACAALAGWCGIVAAAQQATRPTFSSTVDVVSVDVSVIDGQGRPIGGLDATDFTLTVDGRPRKILSAQFIASAPAGARAGTPPADYSTNAAGLPGRVVAIVVDRGSIAPVRAKDVFTAAARFVDGLEPSDRVGLFLLPDGPAVDFTTAHEAIVSALLHTDGRASDPPAIKYVGVSEALEFERGNRLAMDEVIDRECGGGMASARGSTGMSDQGICQRLVQDEAAIIAAQAHERARQTLNGLRGLLERLGSSETPKTIVLISEGLVIDGERLITQGLGRLLASAHATIYAMKPEASDSEASQARAPQNRSRERAVQETGLALVTRLGGGEMFRIVADPDFSFRRLSSELSGYYLLGFEPDASDRDGSQHAIAVGVRRSGVQVRSRSEFRVDTPSRADAERVIGGLLRSPAFATALPFRLTTYAFQDPDSTKIRLLVAIEVDRPADRGETALGLVLVKPDGETAATFYQPSIDMATGSARDTQTCFATLLVEPGTYTLRAAMVDEKGRRGSLDRSVRAYMTRMARFRATQLLIGDGEEQAGAEKIVPTVSGNVSGGQLHAYMELFSDSPGGFDGTSVTLEVVRENATSIAGSAAAALQPAGADPRVRAATGVVPLSRLPAGPYLARAVVAIDGRQVGVMTRPFRIVRP